MFRPPFLPGPFPVIAPPLRDFFDQHLEYVLGQLPDRVHQLLEEVPLIVEDYPDKGVLRRMNIGDRGTLCGLYTGVPLTKRSVQLSGIPSDVIYIFREGILRMCRSSNGRQIDTEQLRRQIRITILHELGHHHGLDEDDLEELGYG